MPCTLGHMLASATAPPRLLLGNRERELAAVVALISPVCAVDPSVLEAGSAEGADELAEGLRVVDTICSAIGGTR